MHCKAAREAAYSRLPPSCQFERQIRSSILGSGFQTSSNILTMQQNVQRQGQRKHAGNGSTSGTYPPLAPAFVSNPSARLAQRLLLAAPPFPPFAAWTMGTPQRDASSATRAANPPSPPPPSPLGAIRHGEGGAPAPPRLGAGSGPTWG